MDQTKKKNERHAAKGFSYEECIAAMCPCNDLFFKQLMKNRELTNYMVRLITKEDISLVNIETEKETYIAGVPAIRLDLYAIDGDGTGYNVEMQCDSRGADPRRVRQHISLMDVEFLQEQEHKKDGRAGSRTRYEQLPRLWIIFITETDVLHSGLFINPIHHKIEGAPEIPFDDGIDIMFISASLADDSELGDFVHDLWCCDISEMRNERMRKEVEYYKKTENGVEEFHDVAQEYMAYWINVMSDEKAEEKVEEKVKEKVKEIVEEKAEENMRKTIIHGLELGLDAEAICGFNEDISKELIQKVAEENREELIRRGVEFPLKI